ncbi:MAG: DUF4065 domain-containing protein [Cytophagia bacterium]|nr:DUF4065 domain-containing protein [Cytophagia bacterium]
MYSCFDIAKEFLKLAKEEGSVVDPMKLLKLTYIAQGYYLAFWNKPLYNNRIEAWKYGPVIPDLYRVTKRFGYGQVDSDLVDLYAENELGKDEQGFLKALWGHYGSLSGLELSSLTHQNDSPWKLAYKEGERATLIDNEAIKKYYDGFVKKKSGGNGQEK